MTRRYVIRKKEASRYLVEYRRDLDEQQYAVVTAEEGPLLVLAGAGSGKTRAVTYRVARLIESGVPPSRILLVTYTNRAAHHMLRKVEALVQSDVRRVWGGTFHSVANRVLRRNPEILGYGSTFTILDTEDARQLMEAAIEDAGVDQRATRFPKADLLCEIISFARNRDRTVSECVGEHFPHFRGLTNQIELVGEIFRQRKALGNAMDYDDLLLNWRRLLIEFPDIRDYWSEHFLHILVDEYQDTNRIQAAIVDLLAERRRSVMVVGDDAQAIFAWRGAHFANLYTFKERYPDAREFRLETNYRSRPEILLLANASIRNNKKQFAKNLRAARQSAGTLPGLAPLRDVDQQAAFVAGRVLELRESGISLDQIGVLYRSHWQALELQLELARRNIPFVVRSGLRFFEQAHIKDVTSYLRAIVNPRDEYAWKRILKLVPGLGKARIGRIWDQIREADDPVAILASGDWRLRPKAGGPWRECVLLLNQLRDVPMLDHPASQIEAILAGGYEEHLKQAYDNPDARAEDLRQLANYASRFDSTEQFLSELALINSERFRQPRGVVAQDVVHGAAEDEMLTLSSIHQAKGLEWRVLFLIWAAEGKFPSARSLRDPDTEEEERRLFYVSVTRARDELTVCYPLVTHGLSLQTVIQRPSRFVTEVPAELFEIWSIDEEGDEDDQDRPALVN